MNLNNNLHISCNVECHCFSDTTLGLNCFCSSDSNNPEQCRDVDYGCDLKLGLGSFDGTINDSCCTDDGTKTKDLRCSAFRLDLLEGAPGLKLGLCCDDAGDRGETGVGNLWSGNGEKIEIPVVDEGSTSAKRSGGGYVPLLQASGVMEGRNLFRTTRIEDSALFPNGDSLQHAMHQWQPGPESSSSVDLMMDGLSERDASCISLIGKDYCSKGCNFFGFSKGARGVAELCVSHDGGGQRCRKPGGNSGAESRGVYYKPHGGRRRCEYPGCTRSAECRTGFCVAHGGGRRCGFSDGCHKAARGKSGLCIRHGGGKRCRAEGCTRSAEGQAGLCISHGGGRRCQHKGCLRGAQGSTAFCKAHGGGKRCTFTGCNKGAEGSTSLCKGHGGGKRCLFGGGGICPKSVHGGTSFCVAHGGGKRCVVQGCTKSARGRSDRCVRHGGGKRCRVPNCGKSAQGSTELCKAHGGGKRCTWGNGTCEKFARGKSGLCVSHGITAHGAGTGGPSVATAAYHDVGPGSTLTDCTHTVKKSPLCEHMSEPGMVAPLLENLGTVNGHLEMENVDRHGHDHSVEPEGRVHGGCLVSLFGATLRNMVHEGRGC